MDKISKQNYEKFVKKLHCLLYENDIDQINDCLLEKIITKIEDVLEENKNLNIAVDFSVDNIHLTDGEGTVLRVNSAFERRMGFKREDVEGKRVADLVEEGAYSPSTVQLAIQEKRKLTMIQEGPGGKVITTSTPVLDESGNLIRVVSNARLIEELKLLNEYFHEMEKGEHYQLNPNIIFVSDKMKLIKKQLDQVCAVDTSIIFTGESGTGKTMLARYVHEKSKRADNNFIEINCAAIPENLIESELFGYDAGAFTGAKKSGKAGLIELAHGGTLFLDEIGDMPLNLQAKLLQVLQNKKITRVGGSVPIDVDVRIISATNKKLEEMIKKRTFRQDLYYRLNVVPIYIPALRERKDDITPLIDYFIDRFNKKYDKNVIFSRDVIKRMIDFQWFGNIRELENLIERMMVTDSRGLITIDNLPNHILLATGTKEEDIVIRRIMPLKEALEEVEKKIVLSAYNTYKSSYKVAKSLKISQSAAHRKIMKYRADK